MSIERTWRCDAPDCDRHAGPYPHAHEPPGFVTVYEGVSTKAHPELMGVFCSRDCAMRYCAQFEPPEIVS